MADYIDIVSTVTSFKRVNTNFHIQGYPPTKIPSGFQLLEINFTKDLHDGLGLSIVQSSGGTSHYFQVSDFSVVLGN